MLEVEKLKPEPSPFDKDEEVLKIYDEAVEVLKKEYVYEEKFNQKQTAKLMRGFVDETVRKQRADASLETMNVVIEENKGSIYNQVPTE